MNNKTIILPFDLNGNKYFYDLNKDAITLVSEKAYELLSESNDNYKNNNELESLKKQGFLSMSQLEMIDHPAMTILNELLERKVGRVCLQITQKCNFRCDYCVYSGNYYDRSHSNKEMSWDIAKKSIDFMLSHSADANAIDVSFYGGEPLLNPDLITKCMEYTLKKAEGKLVSFHVTTNGSLLTDEIIEALLKSNSKITVSLDGPKEIQDKNRKTICGEGTFDLVFDNIKQKLEKYPNLYNIMGFNMVMDPSRSIKPIIDFLKKEKALFSRMNLNTAVIVDDWRKEPLVYSERFMEQWKYGEFRYMLFLLNRLSVENMDLKIFSGAFFRLIQFAKETRQKKGPIKKYDHHTGPCVPGQLRLFVDVEGNFFPCERVSESTNDMIIGNIETGFDIEKVKKLLNIGELTKNECKDCFAFRHCVVCATMADEAGKITREKKLHACQISKVTFENMLKDLCALKECGLTVDNIRISLEDPQ